MTARVVFRDGKYAYFVFPHAVPATEHMPFKDHRKVSEWLPWIRK